MGEIGLENNTTGRLPSLLAVALGLDYRLALLIHRVQYKYTINIAPLVRKLKSDVRLTSKSDVRLTLKSDVGLTLKSDVRLTLKSDDRLTSLFWRGQKGVRRFLTIVST